MCYDITSGLQTSLKYAKHRGDKEEVERLNNELEQWRKQNMSYYHVRGFAHPKILVFTDDKPYTPQAFTWGLIPSWVKSLADAKKLWNSTLNARGETMWEKPSFKASAKSKRCLIYIDAFYEHHHFGGKTYPFRLEMADGSPFAVAGLWNDWTDKETGEVLNTFTLVTTSGNRIMSKIHNSSELEFGPRMPAFIPKEKQDDWLIPLKTEADKAHLNELLKPFPGELLKYHTAPRLLGKQAVGNIEAATQEFTYEELPELK